GCGGRPRPRRARRLRPAEEVLLTARAARGGAGQARGRRACVSAYWPGNGRGPRLQVLGGDVRPRGRRRRRGPHPDADLRARGLCLGGLRGVDRRFGRAASVRLVLRSPSGETLRGGRRARRLVRGAVRAAAQVSASFRRGISHGMSAVLFWLPGRRPTTLSPLSRRREIMVLR